MLDIEDQNLRHLISGVAGFIGSHLCEQLLADGHVVVGLDNLSTGSLRNLEHLNGNESQFQFIQYDVTKPPNIQQSFDHVWHLASLPSPKSYMDNPIETLEVCSSGTRHMLDVAYRHNARFLLASTSECYGDPKEHPQSEKYWGNVNSVGPRSCYDEGKRYAEALTMAYSRKKNLRTNIARIFNTYGSRMGNYDGRAIPQFINQALHNQPIVVYGDGSQTRSFCYISDMVTGLIILANSEERDPVNLGNPEESTILEVAERIRSLLNSKSKIEFVDRLPDDPRRRCPNIEKAQHLFNWTPKVSLQDGLQRSIEYFKKSAAAASSTPAAAASSTPNAP